MTQSFKAYPARVRRWIFGRDKHFRVPNQCWATFTRPLRDSSRPLRVSFVLCIIFILVALALAAGASMPGWIQNIEVRTLLESAIFRTVSFPGGPITIRRPPAETVPALTELIKTQPHPEELYSLRALEEEQNLDFASAEADWKLYLQLAPDKAAAQLALADFYHRRHRPVDEVNSLSALGRLPDSPSDERAALTDRPSWQAFERSLLVIHAQALGKDAKDATMRQYQAWIARFPDAVEVYARYFEYLIAARDFKTAESLVVSYRSKFPKDEVFPVRATALLAYKQGSAERALGIYDRSFKPLWPKELVANYFELLTNTHSLGRFVERARAALVQNPNDLNAVCRIFFYYQQKGKVEAAQQAVTDYRVRKDSRKLAWTSQELYTLATLLHDAKAYNEAARYYFALYNTKDAEDVQGSHAQERALAGLSSILLEAPEQPLSIGAADFSMYSDIATMDTGPGYLNGILSLILNTTSPDAQYAEEEQRAAPYLHRARAAQLIALLDQKFPNSGARPPLHARLIESYAGYGAQDAVIRLGREFLSAFPEVGEREPVALLMADAYSAKGNTAEEFAMYDLLLKELARKAGGVPLGEKVAGTADEPRLDIQHQHRTIWDEEWHQVEEDELENGDLENSNAENAGSGGQSDLQSRGDALSVHTTKETGTGSEAHSAQYASVLSRYLSRLAVSHAVPQALAVLRQELHRNPNDPGLYENLAQFLEQNELGTEQEAVYRRALQQFPERSWYHKLARWYVRSRRNKELGSLLEEVARVFSGTELEDYFQKVTMPSEFRTQLNLYANARFPHNLAFVRNLLVHYKVEKNDAAWEALLRRHWFEDSVLRAQFFEYLSRTGRLEAELAELKLNQHAGPGQWASAAQANPAAVRFAAEAELWRSHFEEGAPALGALAALYPAQVALGREASSVYRSLAYFNSANTGRAVQIELNLLAANPQSRDTLARIGDIYSDRGQFRKAAPYWNRMPATEPGNPRSYEMAATVFWDYYFFPDALRLLNQGRTKLRNNNLYSYEMGAIYEGGRDYPKAVEEYAKGAMHEGEDSSSRKRLLQLSTRHATASLADAATLQAVTLSGYGLEAVRLRAEVLEKQTKNAEEVVFLNSVLDRTASLEVAEGVEQIARTEPLRAVHRHALEREVALSGDPMRRLQLRFELAHFCEDNDDLAGAERNIEAIYRENPRIMGVVRSTVDFYWRNKKQQRAIEVLMQAARDSHHELATSFTYEAARKMTDAKQYGPARKLLTALLQEFPYNNEYAAAVADTYLHSGDNAGLRDFYLTRIAFFRTADLPKENRQSEITSFRRALIPQLTALKDHTGAVDQYIEIINAYPDDEALSTEAALYALRHGRKDQLINFYRKTVATSPQDSRWVVVLARLQTAGEDFEAAIQTFSHAIKIRPDRADLLSARAALEERLMRFDEAAADYATLYERTYHDSQWMEKVAEIRARQNRPEPAVQALRTALIEGRAERPDMYFTVAERLEGWGMLSPAREYAERGTTVAGDDLLAASENHSGAEIYVRIMTRMRMQEAAWQRLEIAVKAAHNLPPMQKQLEKKGLDAITDWEWKANLLRTRERVARGGMARCMRSMGSTASLYFTPEEKEAFLLVAENKNAVLSRDDAYSYLVPLAKAAGFAGLEASLLYENLRTEQDPVLNEFVDLQVRRLKLAELGQQLEEIARHDVPDNQGKYLYQAADIYHLAGQPADELRVLKVLDHQSTFGPWQQERFFELLLKLEPQELLDRARSNDKRGDESANFILAHTDMKMTRAAIEARKEKVDPVWRWAYLGLAGLYFKDTDPRIGSAFLQALSDETIGQRIKHSGDRSEELAGDVWFYYGSRYGEYLAATRRGDPEGWLPAQLEQTPGQSSAYFNSALYYEGIGDTTNAIEDYQHTLELSPKRVDAHDQLADIYWKQKRKDQALSEWRQALEALKNQVGTKSYDLPESFRNDYVNVSRHLGSYGLLAQFHSQLNGLLHAYAKHSDSYRLLPLLRSSLAGPNGKNDPKEATALVLDLSRDSADQLYFLGSFAESNPKSKLRLQMEPVYRRILELAQERVRKEAGPQREYAQYGLREWQMRWLEFLLNSKQYDRLRSEIGSLVKELSASKKDSEYEEDNQPRLIGIQIQLAAATDSLDSLLASFNDSQNPPASRVLKETARVLQQAGDRQSARKILEFVFRREIENHDLDAANMLGLAEIRIEGGDLQAGVALLRRMTLVAGAPFETQEPAAALLMRTGHPQEAINFLKELVIAAPWNVGYRASLAQAQIAANTDSVAAHRELVAVALDKNAPYEVRVSGAKALKANEATEQLGSRELNLLASGQVLTAEAANHRFFLAARLKASEKLEPAKRAHLLRAALEDYPDRDGVRPSLLRAAMRTGDYYLAVATMKPLVTSRWLGRNQYDYRYLNYNPDEDAETDSDSEQDDDPGSLQTGSAGEVAADEDEVPGSLDKQTAEQKAEVAREIGMAFERLGELKEAVTHLTEASRLESSATARKQIAQELCRIRGILKQRKENSSRQPQIHDALEQYNVVRPRLTEAPVRQRTAMQGVHP